ncbi:hypothetical protein HHI36_024050 [Cryptolaemus montrouzieri]|uniref:Uncharacterized protein n=1 Tax=Cryptolaemus montrouzieri TaxID=559131 RepID=A0ABD2NJE8_9CUCU
MENEIKNKNLDWYEALIVSMLSEVERMKGVITEEEKWEQRIERGCFNVSVGTKSETVTGSQSEKSSVDKVKSYAVVVWDDIEKRMMN